MYRSRLSRLEERRSVRKATLLGLGTVVMVALVVLLGVPAVIRMAGFLSDLKSANKPVDKNDFIPPPPPFLVNPYTATSSARQVISGSAEPGVTVYVYRESDELGSVVAADDGQFQLSDIMLSEGKNDFVGVAIDGAGNKSQNSKLLTIYYLNKKPKLEIETPKEGDIVKDKAKVEVKGATDPGVKVLVNQRLIIVDSEGKFVTLASLNLGENKIVVEAIDQAQNSERIELTVHYSP